MPKGTQKPATRRRPERSSRPDPGSTTTYSGPIILPQSNEQKEIQKVNFSYYVPLTASGAGVVDAQYGSGNVTLAGDWSSVAGAWHEYRVLGFKTEFVPYKNFVTTNQWPPMYSVLDRASGSTLGSYAAAANHESAKLHSSWNGLTRKMTMSGPEESVWTPIGTTFSWGYVKLFATGFANTQVCGAVAQTFLLELRGRA